nr:unnamed protein product [Digitaria exilis]
MEAVVRKVQQRVRKVQEEMDLWDNFNSGLLTNFNRATLVIGRLKTKFVSQLMFELLKPCALHLTQIHHSAYEYGAASQDLSEYSGGVWQTCCSEAAIEI